MSLNAYCFLLILVATLAESRGGRKRELPLSSSCDPRISGSCFKADLVSTSVADCKRENFLSLSTCKPINDYSLSNVVDVPDVTAGQACNPTSGLPIRCGSEYDTRCVCDSGADYKKPLATLANQCRCQYWPEVDIRKNKPSYCTQYDHGGETNLHFFACCDNSNDQDSSCSGQTYQGGGSSGDYCSSSGLSNAAGGGRITYRFNCVSCNQQETCRNRCNMNKFSTNVPGLCPLWAGCFRGCCTKADLNRLKRQTTNGTVDVGEFCGDEICQTGEDQLNCPGDCCPNVNPDVCQRNNCSNPQCCFDSRCCIYDAASDTPGSSSSTNPTTATTPSSALSSFRHSLKLTVVLSYLFVFLLLSYCIIA